MKASEALFQLLDRLGYHVCGTVDGAESTEYVPVDHMLKEQIMAEIDRRFVLKA